MKNTTLFTTLTLLVIAAALPGQAAVYPSPKDRAQSQDVSLAWDPNPEPDIAGYRVYWGTSARSYTNFVQVPGNLQTATVSNLVLSTTYHFAATAINEAGLESDFSEEVSYSTPSQPSAPQTIVISSTSLNININITNTITNSTGQ